MYVGVGDQFRSQRLWSTSLRSEQEDEDKVVSDVWGVLKGLWGKVFLVPGAANLR